MSSKHIQGSLTTNIAVYCLLCCTMPMLSFVMFSELLQGIRSAQICLTNSALII